ncbi:MAG: ABC transporter permease [Oscillibacter sp.]|nr:ABC transporter permease [Oscillibacter sp.]
MEDMLKTLTRRSFAASRVRNWTAVLAIALTAALFTAVTTLVIGTMESFTLTLQMQKMSRSDGDIRYMTAEQFEAMRQADFIETAGLRMPVAFLSNAVRHNIEFNVADEIQAGLTFCAPSHGRPPSAPNEVVASDAALRDLGAEPEVGAEITIAFTAHGRDYVLPMVVSGWYEAPGSQLSVLWAGTAFREAYPEIFRFTYREDRDMTGTYFSDFTARSPLGLEKNLRELVYALGGEPEDENAPNYLLATVNRATNVRPDGFQIAAAAAFAVLFMLCGYLLIYNVFDIAVMQDIRRFGLYRTIGMSRKQVRTLMNRQALWLSGLGIPLGMLAGFFIGKAALPLIMNMVSTEYENLAVRVSLSPALFLTAAALTALTVFCSTRKPVRTASNTPPMEAFRYVEHSGGRRASRRSALGTSIPRLAWTNLGRNRRRTAFILLSLALCVVLLNCAGTAADSVDVEKETAFMIRTDFAVVHAASSSNVRGFLRRSDALRAETIADIAARPGVAGGSVIYKNTVEDVNVTYDFGHPLTGETFVMEDSGLTFGTDQYRGFGLGSDGRMLCNVYGMEETALARMDLREGETDAHVLYQKMSAGEGVLVGVSANRQDMSLQADLDLADVGQVITVYKNGSPVLELPVLAKAALSSDDMEIGYISSGPFKTGGDGLFLYLPASVYEELYDAPAVYKYSFDIEDGYEAEMTAFLEDYMEQTDPNMSFLSAREARESAEGTQRMIRFVGGFVGLIFGFAGVLNLINTMITSILTRRHEFAAMESVGMTRRQLTGMMVWEGVSYAAGGCLLGLVLAVVLDLTLVKGLVDSMWQFTFCFTLVPALGACLVLLPVSAVVPVLALRWFRKGSIVEQLRAAE